MGTPPIHAGFTDCQSRAQTILVSTLVKDAKGKPVSIGL